MWRPPSRKRIFSRWCNLVMRTILFSLAWKEWHEHKWKLASIVAILWTTAALALHYGQNDGFGVAMVLVSWCVVPLALFVGLSSAANERSRGTMAFLQALPAPMWRAALTKLIFGLLTLIMSSALTLSLLYGWNRWVDRSTGALTSHDAGRVTVTGNIYLDVFLLFVGLAASLYIWSSAAGVNRKDEVSAAAVALAVMIGWWVLLVVLGFSLFGSNGPIRASIQESIMVFGLSTAPAGFLPASGPLLEHAKGFPDLLWYRYLLIVLITATTTHVALACWYVCRFGRTANLAVRSPQTAVRQPNRLDWLSAPRETAISAITWKQFRESGPLVLAGVAGIIGITLGVFCANASWFLNRPGEFVGMVSAVGICIGFAITLIVGIGICFYDVNPQQNTFWRSRPINPDVWYWVKFFAGLLILVCTLFIPLLAVVKAFQPDPSKTPLTSDSVTALLLGQAALFAAAVTTTCLVRHAVYGAILSVPLMYCGVVVIWMGLKFAGAVGWTNHAPARMAEMSRSELALGFLFTFVVSAVLGWLATRYDWGRKSRY
jgi:hypothetical protein